MSSLNRPSQPALLPSCLILQTELLNTTWKAHRVTPLHNFSYDQSSLKAYSRSLTAALRAQANRGQGVAVSLPESEQALSDSVEARIVVVKVSFCLRVSLLFLLVGFFPAELNSLFTFWQNVAVNAEDPDAVLFTVERPGDEENKNAFKLMLCSVGAPRGQRWIARLAHSLVIFAPLQSPPFLFPSAASAGANTSFTHLPVGLLRGSGSIARHVFDWLQVCHYRCFLCRVPPNICSPATLIPLLFPLRLHSTAWRYPWLLHPWIWFGSLRSGLQPRRTTAERRSAT